MPRAWRIACCGTLTFANSYLKFLPAFENAYLYVCRGAAQDFGLLVVIDPLKGVVDSVTPKDPFFTVCARARVREGISPCAPHTGMHSAMCARAPRCAPRDGVGAGPRAWRFRVLRGARARALNLRRAGV